MEENVDQKLKAVRLEKETLELEALRDQVNKINSRKAQSKLTSEQSEQAIRDAATAKANREANCQHKKGGQGENAISNGHDAYYSVIKHTYPWGETRVMCLRCQKEWTKNDPDYRTALNFPTDNQPSGNAIFAGCKF